jgi:simple sugar transport system ATP-binding protein
MAAPVAEAAGVSKRFGVTQALSAADLSVAAGETHALVGRNGAGKSTLVGLLTGVTRPDAGELRFSGEPAPSPGARKAWQERVACVYQQPTVVPWLTVAENLFLNAQPRGRGGFIRWRHLRDDARALLSEWGVEVDVTEPAFQLSVEERQLVEIVRALHQGSRFVILDEPTAQLDAESSTRLFEHIGRLKGSGVTFLYISHHLSEIFGMCDSVTVLRNGRTVLRSPLRDVGKADVVAAMVGEGESAQSVGTPRTRLQAGTSAALAVEGFTVGQAIGPLSFAVREGECVGLAGQRNSGVLEIGRALVGLERARGELTVGDQTRRVPRNPAEALAAGIAFAPEDRHESGFVPAMSVTDNSTMAVWPRLSRGGVLRVGEQREVTRKLIDRLAIHAGERDALAHLSGGNQQKVMMGRALARDPVALVLLHPTAGVDIASKDSLFAAIDQVCEAGCGTLIVSDELDELHRCDRVLVVVNGCITHEHGDTWDEERLIAQMEGSE